MLARLSARLRVDPYILALLAVVLLAAIAPAHGAGAHVFDQLTDLAILLLFFLYGVRLSPAEAWLGARNLRLHLCVLAFTYAVFPLLGLLTNVFVPRLLSDELYVGMVFLCALPSTVQSSIAFTSIARGNVAAALCAASASNLLGVLVTPLLTSLLLRGHGVTLSGSAVQSIFLQLVAPFLAGQLARPWLAERVIRHKGVLSYVDRSSILLVVYTAFSEGVTSGIWQRVSWPSLLGLIIVCTLLLLSLIGVTTWTSRRLGFSKEDEIAIVFCGSKKSMASGLPMASVLFPPSAVGLAVLPLMLFHQLQLMLCAWLARRYAARFEVGVE